MKKDLKSYIMDLLSMNSLDTILHDDWKKKIADMALSSAIIIDKKSSEKNFTPIM